MDKSERDQTRATARHSVEMDRGRGTNFTTAWLLMQRARLTQLKTASADLEEVIRIYEAELRDEGVLRSGLVRPDACTQGNYGLVTCSRG